MKLRAIRLCDVGGFERPVAVEGFSGGLDVLLGPNEMGKSTLFRALETVFFRKHSARGAFLSRLTPNRGGTPLIEADFEIGGATWRIVKQYGQGKRATLQALSGCGAAVGGATFRNADAEAKLYELLQVSEGASGRFGALWVGQRRGLGPPQLDYDPETRRGRSAGEESALVAALDQEIADAAGGTLVADARAYLMEAAQRLLTPTLARPKQNGPLAVALKELETLRVALDEARTAHAQTSSQRARLEVVERELVEVCAPDAVQARTANVTHLRARVSAAQAAADQLKRLEAETRHAVAAETQARERLESYVAAQTEFAALTQEFEGLEDQRGELAAQLTAAESAQQKKVQRLVTLEARVRLQRQHLDRLQQAERGAALEVERMRIAADLERAAELEQRIGTLTETVRLAPVTPTVLDDVRLAQQRLVLAESVLEGASPVLDVSYEAGREGALRIDGQPLAGGVRRVIDAEAVIDIPGVGQLRIAPGGGADRLSAQSDRDAAQARLGELLEQCGVETMPEAEALGAERAAAERALGEAVAALNGLAPDGLRDLTVRLDSIDLELEGLKAVDTVGVDNVDDGLIDQASFFSADDGDGDTRRFDPGTLDALGSEGLRLAIGADEQALREADRGRQAMLEAYHEAGRALDRCQSRSQAVQQRLGELEGVLGPGAERAVRCSELQAAGETAIETMHAAQRSVLAVRETVLNDDAFEELSGRARAAELDATEVENRIAILKDERLELTTLIGAADEAGGAQRLRALEGEVRQAEHDVDRLSREAAALRLAISAIDTARAQSQDRFAAPVYAALAPYLTAVFAGAQIEFGEGFRPVAMKRDGVRDTFDVLSEGTQEQLAVLVRLAFGRVFADAGQGTPVVLDDPLAYADDARIRQVFDALSLARAHHQVIVFSCREQAFQQLQGHALRLTQWDPDAGGLSSARVSA